MDVDTDHGHYDVLPVADWEEPPAGATHTVFHESGERVGYVSAGMAWSAAGAELGARDTLARAASLVAGSDPAWVAECKRARS